MPLGRIVLVVYGELSWDNEGHLASLTDGTLATSYIYDAAGRRLIAKNTDKTVLYLPDGTELEKASNGTILGQRHYGVAVRDTAGLKWIISNHQGTGTAQIDSLTLTLNRRRSMPFGEPRGTQPSWLGSKGYVGGTKDDTGLTHLGAREYDPTTGRFISVDPMFVVDDPRQHNAYQYAVNSPISNSDPSGLVNCGDDTCSGGGGAMDPKKNPGCYGGNLSPSCGGHDTGGGGTPCAKIGKVAVCGSQATIDSTRKRYEEISSSFDCRIYCTEYKIWAQMCQFASLSGYSGICSRAFVDELDRGPLMELVGGEGIFDGDAAGALVAQDGTFRSLLRPNTMVGVTEAEVRSMVPKDWVEQPMRNGTGTRWGSPGKVIGAKGYIEYSYGNPMNPDLLHQRSFVAVRVGGLQYRAAGAGNLLLTQAPAGTHVQIDQLGKPGSIWKEFRRGPRIR